MTEQNSSSCPYCGPDVFHRGQCPRVKAIEYNADGTVKRVEFWDTPAATTKYTFHDRVVKK